MESNFPERPSAFRKAASGVERAVSLRGHLSVDDRDQEWQRVNSYVADVLKDTHVLYAKLARLQGDFAGPELDDLERISESVLDLGEQLSRFMKAFHDGDATMLKSKLFGGQDVPPDQHGPVPSPVPEAQEPPERSEEDYESEIRSEEDSEFEEFEEVPPEEEAEAGAGEEEEGEAA
jgi:hypothetical protein